MHSKSLGNRLTQTRNLLQRSLRVAVVRRFGSCHLSSEDSTPLSNEFKKQNLRNESKRMPHNASMRLYLLLVTCTDAFFCRQGRWRWKACNKENQQKHVEGKEATSTNAESRVAQASRTMQPTKNSCSALLYTQQTSRLERKLSSSEQCCRYSAPALLALPLKRPRRPAASSGQHRQRTHISSQK